MAFILPMLFVLGKAFSISMAGKQVFISYWELGLLGLLAAMAIRHIPIKVTPMLMWLLLGYFGVALSASLLSADPLHSLILVAYQLENLVVLMIVTSWLASQDPLRAAQLMLDGFGLAAGIMGAQVIWEVFNNPMGWQQAILYRAADLTWARSNYLAAMLVLLLPTALMRFLKPTAWWMKLGQGLSVAAVVAGIFVSGSRGAVVGLLGMAVVYLFVLSGNAHRHTRWIVLVLGGLGYIVFQQYFGDILGWRYSPDYLLSSMSVRQEVWLAAWDAFLRRPVMGNGLGGFINQSINNGLPFLAHNWLFNNLAGVGIVGTLLFFSMMLIVLQYLMRLFRGLAATPLARDIAAIGVGIIGSLVHGLVENNFGAHDFDFLFWSLVACAIAIGNRVMPGRADEAVGRA